MIVPGRQRQAEGDEMRAAAKRRALCMHKTRLVWHARSELRCVAIPHTRRARFRGALSRIYARLCRSVKRRREASYAAARYAMECRAAAALDSAARFIV